MKNIMGLVIAFVLAFTCYGTGLWKGYDMGKLKGMREGREKGEQVGFERGWNNAVYYMQVDSNWAKKQCANDLWN